MRRADEKKETIFIQTRKANMYTLNGHSPPEDQICGLKYIYAMKNRTESLAGKYTEHKNIVF